MNKDMKRKGMLMVSGVIALSVMGTVPAMADYVYPTKDGAQILNQGISSSEEYRTWYDTQWNGRENGEMDTGRIVLTPGINERSLNFAWYSETQGEPQVRISSYEDMRDAKVFKGETASISKTNLFHTYTASNKVSVNDFFAENSQYWYQTSTDGENWSQAYPYTTHSFSSYTALLVGDPQIGATGSNGEGTTDDLDLAVNTFTWNKTLTQAMKTAPDAGFILAAGDQIDHGYNAKTPEEYEIREQEYAGFTYPEILRSLPVAATIGNHETNGDDFQYHYNTPNDTKLGMTESGGDYYYSYGNTLYVVLNSNNRNMEEHRAVMDKAVESHKDAKWKIVMFHHDIYGAGNDHANVDGANLRILFAPLMDEYDIDVCFTGHDHSYARTFQIEDGTVIETNGVNEDACNAKDPEGTLYVTAGSATGSKFYLLSPEKQYYLAERSNKPVPTYSTVSVSDNELKISTYDYEGNKYAADVTVTKTNNAKKSIFDMREELEDDLANDKDPMTKASSDLASNAVKALDKAVKHQEDPAFDQMSDNYGKETDPVDYFAFAKDEYKDPTAEKDKRLKEGFSTLLDKTYYHTSSNIPFSKEQYDSVYELVENAYNERLYTSDINDFISKVSELKTALLSANVDEDLTPSLAGYVQLLEELLDPNQYGTMYRSSFDLRVKTYEDAKNFYEEMVIGSGNTSPEQNPSPEEHTDSSVITPNHNTSISNDGKVETSVTSHPLAYTVAMIASVACIIVLNKNV